MENAQNHELKKKFMRKQTFYHEMQGISKKFLEFQQQVLYLPVKDINENMIISIKGKQQKTAIFKREDFFIINGQYQPSGNRGFQKLILQIVQYIPRPSRSFGIIYINTLASSDAYNDFKKVLELLPFQYLSNLTKVYVLQASFMNKAFFWLSFGTVTNYIKNKTINVESLKQIEKYTHFDVQFLKKTLPKNTIQQLQKNEIKPMSQSQPPRKNLRTHEPDKLVKIKSDQNPKYSSQLFPTIQAPPELNKKLISDYELGPTGAPKVLQLMIYYFKNREQNFKAQGIFRKSVSIDDETEILRQLQLKNYNYLENISDPHIIANAIKRFLSNLRIPLIPFELFDVFMTKDGDPQYKQLVIQSIINLPKINKMSIFLLFNFLRKVILYANDNKMTENNICIVFGPCLMRSQISSIKDLIYAKKIIVATSIIYQQFQAIFGDVQTRNILKRNSYNQYRKGQILQKLNKDEQSPKKQNEPIILDKTSDFIKETLAQKQNNQCYLELTEVEEAINNIPNETKLINKQKFMNSIKVKQNFENQKSEGSSKLKQEGQRQNEQKFVHI